MARKHRATAIVPSASAVCNGKTGRNDRRLPNRKDDSLREARLSAIIGSMQAEVPTITVCGSAAAEGVPAYFCNCRVCREAAERGGREIRGRTSYNFGGVLQIDFGPDSLQAFQRHRTALNAIRHILVTHAHTDHLSPRELSFHGGGYCLVPAHPGTITVHGTRPALDRIRSELRLPDGALRGGDLDRIGLELAPVRAFRRVEMPDRKSVV